MANLRVAFCAMALVAVAAADVGAARTLDPLRCFRVSDQAVSTAVLDVETLPCGVDAGCRIKPKSRELCVPASADVSGPVPGDAAPSGENRAQERLCYRIQCPKRSMPTAEIADRFGSRSVALGAAKRFSTPVTVDTEAS